MAPLVAALALCAAAFTPRSDKTMREAAVGFLAALTPDQVKKTVLPFNSDTRLDWHYVPRERAGIPFAEMSPAQREAAVALLRAGLSAKGFQRVETVRKLESVLREIEQGHGPLRDPDQYHFAFFGRPSDREPWGWRYEGHHISLHFTCLNDRVIATSPQFLGANPAEVREGPMKGTRVLGPLEDLARALLKQLDGAQRAQAVLSDAAPADILTGAARKAAIQEDRGIAYHDLAPAQQGLLLALIAEHASVQRPETARVRLDAIRKAGLDGVRFAWMGGDRPGQGHYYRVQGPTFLIEYDNTQNDANHIHAVWRDFRGDWGADLLEQHYRESPHHHE